MANDVQPPPESGSYANAADDLFDRAARRPDHVALSRKVDGEWRPVTSREFAGQVMTLAAGLVSAGIRPGDRVALMSATRFEWTLCDLAIWTAGAVTVPIYETSAPAQIAWILADSAASAVIVEDKQGQVAVEGAQVSSVRHLWQIEDGDLDRLSAAGTEADAAEAERRRRAVTAGSPATIVYTSGTTGRPKGCVLTHGALIAEVRSVCRAEGILDSVLTEDASILLFLPLAHVLARVIQLCALRTGARLGHFGDVRSAAAELAAFRPTLLPAVPRVFEKLHGAARSKAVAEGHGKVFDRAEAAAVRYSRSVDDGGPSLRSRLGHALYDRLVYAKLRGALGGRVAWAISGSAPLNEHLAHFLRGAGINVLEGWGLTETAGGATFNLPSAQRIGTVGRPLPGCAVRIAPDGEVLVKAPFLFSGYWQAPEATREVFDADGWFHTGDLGRLDDDGYLSITGRVKDLIVTASGKNVAPAVLEDRLRAHWMIGECVVVGDRRPYVGVLITLDLEVFQAWKRETRKPLEAEAADLHRDPELLSTVQRAVDEANQAVSHAEAIKRFRILPGEFVIGNELTPTQKVRREYVLRKFTHEVEALYTTPMVEQ